mgnify:CR=1 FL=1
MQSLSGRRIAAWIIDIIIVLLLIMIISLIYHPNIHFLKESLNQNAVSYMQNDISFSEYITSISIIYKQIDSVNIFVSIINTFIVIVYFVVVPYFNKGKTIGKQIQKITVKMQSGGNIKLSSLFIRNLINNGLLYLILLIVGTLVIPENIYFIFLTIIGIIQVVLLFTSMFMIVYRKDRKSLHDIIAHTTVSIINKKG